MGTHEQAAREPRAEDGQHQHQQMDSEAEAPAVSDGKRAASGAAGDAAVRRMLGHGQGEQLAVGHAGDEHEQEADRAAEELVGDHEEDHAPQADAHADPMAAMAGHEASAPPTATAAPAPIQRKGRDGAAGQVAAAEVAPTGDGQPLSSAQRDQFEPRMGDLGQVRLHTDGPAGERAQRMNAEAFTRGNDITFAPGAYRPDSSDGKKLLAHELTHVTQQRGGAGGRVQLRRHHKSGNFFSRAGRNLRRIGRDINKGLKTYGPGIAMGPGLGIGLPFGPNLGVAGDLLAGRIPGIVLDPESINILASHGWNAFCTAIVEKFTGGTASVATTIAQMLEVLPQGSELTELVARLLSHLRPLNGEEKSGAQFVLGDSAIDWGRIRVAQSAGLPKLLAHDKRSVTLGHTIFRAPGVATDTIVHECIHCFQYERLGMQYIDECLAAQAHHGSGAYTIGVNRGGVRQTDQPGDDVTSAPSRGTNPANYQRGTGNDQHYNAQQASIADGGSNDSDIGLVAAVKRGKHYSDFNREQQAQLAQEFYEAFCPSRPWQAASYNDVVNAHNNEDASFLAYCYFIGELRRGMF